MNTIQWAEGDSVGNKEIDRQHKELVSLTNKLFQAILEDRGYEVVLGVLYELQQYAAYHFDYEEKLLIACDYPAIELKEHMDEHTNLKKQVNDFISEFSAYGDTLDIKVFDFLRSWTDEHLSQTDMKYRDYLKDD